MMAGSLFADILHLIGDMKKPTKNITEEQLQQGLAALNELGQIFTGICSSTSPAGGFRLSEIDYNDPEEIGGPINPKDWPDGLGAYLEKCNWELPAKEYNLIVSGLEKHWELPRGWGVFLDEENQIIEAGPIDNPEVQDH